MKGLVIAATHSGAGKTTLTLGLLAAFAAGALPCSPSRSGPTSSTLATTPGPPAAPPLTWTAGCSPGGKSPHFRRRAAAADLAVVEGVMGLFDGYDGASEAGSTAQMAKWLGLPVLLVVDARAMARSAAALVHGFTTFYPGLTLAGVVFNRVGSATHLDYLRQALESVPGGVRCFGGLPREAALTIPARHLGLVTTEDHPLEGAYLEALADLVESHLDLDGLLAALAPAPLEPSRRRPPALPRWCAWAWPGTRPSAFITRITWSGWKILAPKSSPSHPWRMRTSPRTSTVCTWGAATPNLARRS